MKWLREFYQWVKDSAINRYIVSKGIRLNSDQITLAPFGREALTSQDRKEDEQTKEKVWEHVKRIILWSTLSAVIGIPLLILLLPFLAVIVIGLCIIAVPIGIIVFIIWCILGW